MGTASLAQLEITDTEGIYLALNENIALIKSSYPLYATWKMHQPDEKFSHREEIAKEYLHKTTNNAKHHIDMTIMTVMRHSQL